MSDFDEMYMPEPNSGCWLWVGREKGNGYGAYKSRGAHRASYEIHCGEIPKGLVIDHLCRNPMCVNPDHLEPVTAKENTLRGESGPALNYRKDRCAKGHPFDAENTHYRRGRRYCRACQRDFTRRYKERLKAALADQQKG